MLKILTNSAIHLQSLIEDALDLSRIENNKFEVHYEEFDIREVVSETKELMDFPIGQKGLQFITEISDDVPQIVNLDKKRLKQVIFNLVGNAIKFAFEGYIQLQLFI